VLSTIFTTALAAYLSSHGASQLARFAASVHADAVAFAVSAGIFLAGALLAGLMLRSGRLAVSAEPAGAR